MANRIPLVVVSSEQLIKELPSVDDLDLANSSIRNIATANVGNINSTNIIATTANATTVNTTTIVGTSALTISTGTGSNGNVIISANGTEDVRVTPDGNVGIGISTPTSRLHINGTTTLEEVLEKANITSTAMGANSTIDVLDCAVHYYTANSTANTTLNVRGNSTVTLNTVMSANQTLTVAFIITNGATAYRVANLHLDAVNTAIRWSGGSAPTASANSTEAYSFTIIKTAANAQYTVLGSKTQFA